MTPATPRRRAEASGRAVSRPRLLLFELRLKGNVLVATAFNLQKDKSTLLNRSICAIVRALPTLVTAGRDVPFLSLHQRGRPTGTFTAVPCAGEFLTWWLEH